LTLDNEEVIEELDQLDRQSKALKKNLMKMCWYLRGGMTYEEIYQLGPLDRQIINKVVEENLEVAKESGLPFF
jgi:hypothetical protein